MSDTAHWTETDRTRALHWVRDRATTRSLFRIQGVDLAQDLPALRSIREPQNLAQALRLVLTEHTWQQFLLVLGRRQDAPKPPPGLSGRDQASAECRDATVSPTSPRHRCRTVIAATPFSSPANQCAAATGSRASQDGTTDSLAERTVRDRYASVAVAQEGNPEPPQG